MSAAAAQGRYECTRSHTLSPLPFSQAVARLQREAAAASGDLAALYRSAMSHEMRTRERAIRSELQDRETELKTVVAEISRVSQTAQQRAGGAGGAAGGAAGSGSVVSHLPGLPLIFLACHLPGLPLIFLACH